MTPNQDGKASVLPNFLLIGLSCFMLLMVGVLVMGKDLGGETQKGPKGPFVGLMHLDGIIASSPDGGLFSEPSTGLGPWQGLLKEAANNPNLKALVIRINSPGGSAPASEEMYQALVAFKKKKKIKVIVSMADVAASGGYYVAAAADEIYANHSTFTGSIGVVMPLMNYQGLMQKIGLSSSMITSGKFKAMGSPDKPLTAEERTMLQTMSDQVHRVFMEAVSKGRKIPLDQLKKIADGRVLTGEQAKEVGLVDHLGTFTDAVDRAGELAGLGKDPPLAELRHGAGFMESLFGNVRAPNTSPLAQLPGDPLSLAAATMLLAPLPGASR